MKQCFECETTEDLHEHHVVPRSRGGTKTITLCHQCHLKAHGRDGNGLNHSRLIKEALAVKKEELAKEGKKLGNPRLHLNRDKLLKASFERGQKTKDRYLGSINGVIAELQAKGQVKKNGEPSLRAICDVLNDRGIKAPKGGKFHPATIIMIKNTRGIKES